MDELGIRYQVSGVSDEARVEYVWAGRYLRDGDRLRLDDGGVFISWWAAGGDVSVEDVIAFGRAEFKRAFDYVPECFEACDVYACGENPIAIADGDGWVMWAFVHSLPKSGLDTPQKTSARLLDQRHLDRGMMKGVEYV